MAVEGGVTSILRGSATASDFPATTGIIVDAYTSRIKDAIGSRLFNPDAVKYFKFASNVDTAFNGGSGSSRKGLVSEIIARWDGVTSAVGALVEQLSSGTANTLYIAAPTAADVDAVSAAFANVQYPCSDSYFNGTHPVPGLLALPVSALSAPAWPLFAWSDATYRLPSPVSLTCRNYAGSGSDLQVIGTHITLSGGMNQHTCYVSYQPVNGTTYVDSKQFSFSASIIGNPWTAQRTFWGAQPMFYFTLATSGLESTLFTFAGKTVNVTMDATAEVARQVPASSQQLELGTWAAAESMIRIILSPSCDSLSIVAPQ